MEPEEPVVLISEDDRDREVEFDHAVWKIAAGTTVYWPWKIACHLLGDPSLRNTESFNHRQYDRERVMQANGIVLPGSITEDEWQEVRPKIVVQTMGGEKIPMLSELPVDAPVDFQTGFSSSDLKVRISELERTISQLTANIEDKTPFVVTETAPNEKTAASLDEIPEDKGGPRKSTRR